MTLALEPDILDTEDEDEKVEVSKYDEQLADLADRSWPLGVNDRVRFDRSNKRWLTWQKHRWVDDEAPAYRLLVERALAWMVATKNSKIRTAISSLLNVAKQEAVMKALSRRVGIRLEGNEFDQDPFLLGCTNGVVDLRTGELLTEGIPGDYITKSIRLPYDPDAPEPTLFLQFLRDVMSGDEEMTAYLLGILGYSLFGYQREQKFWMFVGQGQNGKGTLTKVIHWILDEYAVFAQSTLYMKSRFGEASSDKPRPDLIALQGVRFAPTSEPVGGSFNDEMVKHHTGDDPIRARTLFVGRQVEFRPTHTLIFLTNDPPKTEDVGLSMRRRVRIVEFNERFEGDREDKDLEKKLKEEAPGILRFLIGAAKFYYENGLPEPAKVTLASAEYIEENDPLTLFVRDACVIDRHVKTNSRVLYDAYQDWALANEIQVMSMTGFGLAIQHRQSVKRHRERSGSYYMGIRPRNAGEIGDASEDED